MRVDRRSSFFELVVLERRLTGIYDDGVELERTPLLQRPERPVPAAYDATTGARLWLIRSSDGATALGLSPDGSVVFVVGTSVGPTGRSQIATVAYDASTGAELWVSRYHGPRNGDLAAALGLSPDGTVVFVTGSSVGPGTKYDYATVAYDASTGGLSHPEWFLWTGINAP